MVHGYHAIFGTYGFWLPNDPRGSWSDFVHSWELARFGETTKSLDRLEVEPADYAVWRATARAALRYPPVTLTGLQEKGVAEGFGEFIRKSGLTVWACSILPEHVHFVFGRHRYKIESAVNLLKGQATRQLVALNLRPMSAHRKPSKRLPSMWAEREWKVFLETEEAIDNAIRYVENNPEREGKKRQKWCFVTPFRGLDAGWVTYHA